MTRGQRAVALAGCLALLSGQSGGTARAQGHTQEYSDVEVVPDAGSCIACHQEETLDELSLPVSEWRESVHAAAQVSCDACHGGDPTRYDADEAKADGTGFVENPSWREESEYCGICHERAAESFDGGAFGASVRAGNRAPTCLVCHMPDGHRIASAEPGDLTRWERCARCSGIEDAEPLVRQGAALHTRLGELRGQLSQVAAGGVNLRELEGGLTQQLASYTAAVHRFEPASIQVAAADFERSLDACSDKVLELTAVVEARRRYLRWVIAALCAMLFGLVGYWRTLSH